MDHNPNVPKVTDGAIDAATLCVGTSAKSGNVGNRTLEGC